MIVCICKVVSDRQIKQAVVDGAKTFEDLQMELGVCVKCGTCEGCVKNLLDENVK